MQKSLLEGIDIYGWGGEREDLALSGLVTRSNMLVMGPKGQAKTLLGTRIAEAFDRAWREKGIGECTSTKLDAHTAGEEDLVGYSYPPDDATMREAKENDEPVFMETILSPNTVAFSEFIVLDEATRIPQHIQSKYLSMMNEKVVDGRELELKYLFGAANPITYAATEVMDEALADRWELIIPAPGYEEMPEDARLKVIKSRSSGVHDRPPKLEASLEMWEFIEEASSVYERIYESDLDQVALYVDAVACLLNRSLKGETTSSDPNISTDRNQFTTTQPLGGRRVSMIAENILGLYAVALVRGDKEALSRCGKLGFQYSFVHELHGDEPIPEEAMEVAHEEHGSLLKSKKARAFSMVERKDDPVSRVAMAFRLRIGAENVSQYIKEARQGYIDDDNEMAAMAFSMALFNRLQHAANQGETELLEHVNTRVFDLIVPDVEKVLAAAEEVDLNVEDAHPDKAGAEAFYELLQRVYEESKTPMGRLSLAIAIYHAKTTTDSTRSNPLSAGKTAEKKYRRVLSALDSSWALIDDIVNRLFDLSRHENALD